MSVDRTGCTHRGELSRRVIIFANMTIGPSRLLFFCFALITLRTLAQADRVCVRVHHGSTCEVVVTLEEMQGLTQHSAVIVGHDGAQATYEGPWLKDVLKLKCASLRSMEKRTMVNSYLRVDATDGYTALVALTEADSSFRSQPVILAWRKSGAILDDHDGPLQLIVPDDLRHARDVRKVKRLEVVTP